MADRASPHPSPKVFEVTQVRSEYTSARLIGLNLDARVAHRRWERHPGYAPPQIDYVTQDGETRTISVRDYDVRYLDRVSTRSAAEYAGLIHRARLGDRAAQAELQRRAEETRGKVSARFAGSPLVENTRVIPYTTDEHFPEALVSHKGFILLDLSQRGFATADFSILTSDAYHLSAEALEACLRDSIRNLEVLSGRRFGDPDHPLLVAVRSAMPSYIPGFMPTFLNVGLTPEILPGLPQRYGPEAAVRIHLNNRKTLLEALDPEAFARIETSLRPGLSPAENQSLIGRIEEAISRAEPGLLTDAFAQVRLCLSRAYEYYRDHQDVLRNFTGGTDQYPAVIIQRMVCSVIDQASYAGVLYSRHPRLGLGVFLQFARTIYGEDLMTGRLQPEERHFLSRDEAKTDFPAVYHFWDRLFQLEEIFQGPVMVEFTGVHGTFTVLQVNAAELAGAGMLTAVMDMHRAGRIPAERVRELIQPYHVRQIESDAIDPRSLQTLKPFGRGVAVLPRSAVSGRISFSAAPQPGRGSERVVWVKERFTPQDAVDMQSASGICSLSPAAIHVVTTAQNLGIPALLNLEEGGVRIDASRRRLINDQGLELGEGDWVTISSRQKTLFCGPAVFAPARLLRFMAGEPVELAPEEKPRFGQLAADYDQFRRIAESVAPSEYQSLQDLGHAIRFGELRSSADRARKYVNLAFDHHPEGMARRLLETSLGSHLINRTAYERLTAGRRIQLLRSAIALCCEQDRSGYQAGAFVLGYLVEPAAAADFWRAFAPRDIAFLLNEWVLHQKYLGLLDDVGERKINRARDEILCQGLGARPLNLTAAAGSFLRLKLGGVDLEAVRQALPDGADPQTEELVRLLRQPYSAFFDFADARDMARLEAMCREVGRPRPKPTET